MAKLYYSKKNNLFTIRNILRSIFIVIILIESILIAILSISKTLPSEIEDSIIFHILKIITVIILLLIIAIIIYTTEHKLNNKNESILDEEEISPIFDTDNVKNNDIALLSTILNQRYPNKKEIILLLMQLINKRVLNLTMSFDGKNHQYYVERNHSNSCSLNEAEVELINYIFKYNSRADLLHVIKNIYKKNDTKSILRKIRKYVENELEIKESSIKPIYKIITFIIGAILIYLSMMVFLSFFMIIGDNIGIEFYMNRYLIIAFFLAIAIVCLAINFIFLIILKKITLKYQYDNDSVLWLSKIIAIFELAFIITYIFQYYLIVQFIIFSMFTIALLTIMISYNFHITLTKKQVLIKKELISLKNYLLNMNYLTDKEFGNIINYEEYIMYGFLFNITIKINSEFDIIQKEFKECINKEVIFYWNLFKERI